MSTFCSGCGTPLEEGARFCAACGRPVAPAAQPQQPAQQPVPPSAQPQYRYAVPVNAATAQPVQPQAYGAQPQAYGAPQPYTAPKKSKKKLILILSIVGVLLIGGGILLFVLLGNGGGGTSSPDAIVTAIADTYNSDDIDREKVAALTYEYNYTKDEAEKKERVDEIDADSHQWLIEHYGEDARVSMSVSESQSATQESLTRLKAELAAKYQDADKISEVRLVKVAITVASSKKTENEQGSYTLINVNGKWYVFASSSRYQLQFDD